MPAVTYNFTYAAIAGGTMNTGMTVYGGLYGCKNTTAVLQSGSTAVLGTTIAAECTNLENLITSIASDLTTNGVQNNIASGAHVINPYPNWYAYTGIGATSLTFTGNSSSIFYIYSTGEIAFNNCSFLFIGDVNISNIYIISTDNMNFNPTTPHTYFGNFLSNRSVRNDTGTPNVNITGTCSAVSSVNSTYMDYLTITYFETSCFVEGTKVLTDNWYVPVEELKVGDVVMTHGAILRRNGKKFREVDTDAPMQVLNIHKCVRPCTASSSPIVITKNAFGPNKPFDDLYVSCNHGIVTANGHIYPANKLVNKTTIYQDNTIDRITYYHIELATHNTLTANGIMAETYWPE